jgi:hypothetical protein
VAENRALWIFGWLAWNMAAVSILLFFASFAAAHANGRPAAAFPLRFAVYLCAAAIAPDLAAEALEMGVLPGLAADAVADARDAVDGDGAARFLALHRAAVMATGYVANGLYSIASLVVAVSTRRAYAGWIVTSGLAVAASGLFLSASALAEWVEGMVAAHFVLVPALLAWQVGVALDARWRSRCRQEMRPGPDA